VDCDSCSEEDGVCIIFAISSWWRVGLVLFGGLVVLVDDVGGGGGRVTYVVGSAATFATMEYLLSRLVLQ
jgi:hypothetical protein